MELAVNEINASDSTIKFEFLSQDDEADGEKAVNAYNNMMDNGMQVLVGPTTTGASIAVADACYTDRTFMLTPSASSTDVTAGKDNVFRSASPTPTGALALPTTWLRTSPMPRSPSSTATTTLTLRASAMLS